MAADGGITWGTRWTVPGWDRPAPASDLATWLGRGHEGSGEPSIDLVGAPAVAEELDRLRSEGVRALRTPLDWARIEPANGRVDEEAVELLRAALSVARSRGFVVWGTLHDGPLPGWFAHDERGFSDDRSRGYHWARHVETVGELVGDLIDGWIPVVAPCRWAKRAWLDGTRPPGRHDDGGAFARNLEGIQVASVEAARRLRESGRPVASAQWAVPVFPARDDPRLPPSPEAEVAADEVDEVLWRSWWRMLTEEVLVLPGRAPVPLPGARQAFDVLGITYRHAVAVGADRSWRPYPQALPTADDGQVPWAEGLALSLHRLAEAFPERDLVVVDVAPGPTEPEARASYLSEVRDVVTEAASGGMPLAGCFTPRPPG